MPELFDIYRDEFRARVLAGRPRSLLEVGAGDGAFLRTVKGEVNRLAALDPHDEHVANLSQDGFEAAKGVAENLPFAEGEFDVVAFSFTPHHVKDWNQALREALRVARHSVEILDVWYDDTMPDQRVAHAWDRWLKVIDRRTGMIHNDTLPPGELLSPVEGRSGVNYDYVCRRIASPVVLDDLLNTGRNYLAKIEQDSVLAKGFEQIVEDARRYGISDEGCIQMTIEK